MDAQQSALRLHRLHGEITNRIRQQVAARDPLFGQFSSDDSDQQQAQTPTTAGAQPAKSAVSKDSTSGTSPTTATKPAATGGSTGAGTGTGNTGGGTGTGNTGGGTGTGKTGGGSTGGGSTGGGSTGGGGTAGSTPGSGSTTDPGFNPFPWGKGSPKQQDPGSDFPDLPAPSGGAGAGSNHDYFPPDSPAPSTNHNSTTSTPAPSKPQEPTTPAPTKTPETSTTTANVTVTPKPTETNHTSATNSTNTPTVAPLPTNTSNASNANNASNASNANNATTAPPPVVTQVITTVPASSPPPDASIGSSSSNESGTGGAQIGIIIGAIAGGLAGVIVLIWLILIPVRRRQTRQKEVDWAVAFGQDHGPSDNSANVIYGTSDDRRRTSVVDELRGIEKSEPYVMADINRGQMEYAQDDTGMQSYQQYQNDAPQASRQWFDPNGQAYAGGQGAAAYQDYGYDPQAPNYFSGPPSVDPYIMASPSHGPTAYCGWPADGSAPGTIMPPSPHANTPLFAATVQRGYSTSTKSTAVSPAQGPISFKGNMYPPPTHSNGQDLTRAHSNAQNLNRAHSNAQGLNRAYSAGTGTLHSEHGGGGDVYPSDNNTNPVFASDLAAEQVKHDAASEDDIYGGVASAGH
ncbi:hypothetical protein A4X06_0g1918 [Tilletia controversa]|uniref:Uncharacterized protein n=1 Tax=Tilletia controversa TaxID=13291 RepID=A0A8X7SZN2_9BASI|nr:hypothetical protein CF328_g5926 [Tilletia controversa]KAE8252795.1 hypothetical protein A4X06_0g1918 [Tilletia controversa]